jgi:long-chain fatty acid transport protein
MKRTPGLFRAVALVSGMACASTANATTGYFALGYGARSMGMAGAVVSNPQDSIAAASNPAGMALVGERVDVGIRFFNPVREAEISTAVPAGALGAGSAAITYDVEDKSRRNLHYIPNAGYTSRINDRLYWGISIYGNGGMNTTYDQNLYNQTASAVALATGQATGTPQSPPAGFTLPFPDTGTLGVDLAQVLFTPTLALKVNDRHTVGASLVIGTARFSARGLGNFQCFTQTGAFNNPAACSPGGAQALQPGFIASDGLTNNQSDISYGAGVRVGWIGELSPSVTLGATVASKVYMTKFDDYDELFAEDGDFDIPANFSLGMTFKATPKLNLSFDFQRILYEGVASISNPGPVPTATGPGLPCGTPACLLGTDDGMGFGWEDINVYRLGAEYMYDSNWTFRAGFAMNDQPIPSSQVLFNILAPAVIERHATVGFTYQPDKSSEWNFAYMRGFDESVSTLQSAFGFPASISMHQNSVDISYSKKF